MLRKQREAEWPLRFFFSGSPGRAGEEELRMTEAIQCRLVSCHGDYVQSAKRWASLTQLPESNIRHLMLDSGAFTAWSKGKRVDLDELIRTYSEVIELVDQARTKVWLINLDVIPGSPGVTAGPAEIEEGMVQSDKNFEVLVKHFGQIVVPVFHQNETEQRLKQLVGMAEYICASPRNDLPEWTRVRWAEEVHRKVPKTTRTHGLATTGDRMLDRVPWWSVDSASWLYAGAMGSIHVFHGGRWCPINISRESPDVHNDGAHFDNSLPHVKEVYVEHAAKHNISIELLKVDHMARKLFNCLEICDWLKTFQFEAKPHQDSLFDL